MPASQRCLTLLLAAVTWAPVATVGAAQPPRFTLGEARDDVRRLHGAPEVIERLDQLGVEVWTYRSAAVRFDILTGLVTGWDDPQGILLSDPMARGGLTRAPELALGSTGADVVRLLGAPRRVRRVAARDHWGYGEAVIAIGVEDGRVAGWSDPRRRLPVRRRQDGEAMVAFGAVGGTADRLAPRLLVQAHLEDSTAEGRAVGARNTILVTIENAGPGSVFSLHPTAGTTRGSAVVGDDSAGAVASLAAGERVSRRIPVEFQSAGPDSVVVLRVGASTAGSAVSGTSVDLPVRLTAPRDPQLRLEEVRVDDQSGDGRLSPREIAEVSVTLRQDDPARATGLGVELALGRDLFAVAGTPSRFELGTLEPGAVARLRFSVYTLARADSASVTLVVGDRSGRRQRITVPLRLERAAFAGAPSGVARSDIDTDPPVPGPVNGGALAVVFGIDRYRSLPAARYAARDALAVRRHLVTLFGVPDDGDHLFLRADADATGAEFRKAFGPTGWLARRATPQSDIVVFYAGHGAPGADGQPMLLPWDADVNYPAETGIPLSEVHASLARIPARTITLILDACFTGVTRDGNALVPGSRPIVLSVEHPALLREGMTLLAAGQGAQAANDFPAQRHGLFSYWLLRGLRGDADTDGDRRITIGELETLVVREVSRGAAARDREQRPLVIARDTSRVILRLGARRP